jgi:hypothetical protein
LVEPRNPGQTAEALLGLLEDSVRAAAHAARAAPLGNDSPRAVVSETEALYRAVLRRRGARVTPAPARAPLRERAS